MEGQNVSGGGTQDSSTASAPSVSGSQPTNFTPEQALAKIERLKADSGFRERFVNGDIAARDQWDSLNQQAAARPPAQISSEAAKNPSDYGFVPGQFGNPADPASGQEEAAIRQGLHAAGFSPDLGVSYARIVSDQHKGLEGLSPKEVESWAKSQKDYLEMQHGKDGFAAKAKKVEAFLQSIDKAIPGSDKRIRETHGAWSAVAFNLLANHIESLEAQGKKF